MYKVHRVNLLRDMKEMKFEMLEHRKNNYLII